jgi:hypothetical protein
LNKDGIAYSQLQQRREIHAGILQHSENDKWLNRVTTRDASWVFQYDPELKQQSMQWKSSGLPHPKILDVKIKSQDHVHLFFFF